MLKVKVLNQNVLVQADSELPKLEAIEMNLESGKTEAKTMNKTVKVLFNSC